MSEKVLQSKYPGVLKIGEIELECHVLEDGSRIFSSRDLLKAFGLESDQKDQPRVLKSFLSKIRLISILENDLANPINLPVKFKQKGRGGLPVYGYKAELLPEICNAVLKLANNLKLTIDQRYAIERSRILLNAFAKIGIIALVDEATGYQIDRSNNALQILLAQYVAEGIQKWVKTFPDDFFLLLDRLYDKDKTISRCRPPYYGKFINTYIYEPIEKGFLKRELDKKNITDDKARRARFHQWLTQFGKDKLLIQLGRVMAIMESSSSIESFRKKIERQKGLSIAPELFDDLDELTETNAGLLQSTT